MRRLAIISALALAVAAGAAQAGSVDGSFLVAQASNQTGMSSDKGDMMGTQGTMGNQSMNDGRMMKKKKMTKRQRKMMMMKKKNMDNM